MDVVQQDYTWLVAYLVEWGQWVKEQRIPLAPLLVGVVAYFVIVETMVFVRRRRTWRERAARMDPNTRRRREQMIVADLITDGLSDAVEDHLLTKQEAKYWRNLIGQHCNLPDLLPKNNSFNQARPKVVKARLEKLKEAIRKRRANGKTDDKIVVLPGDTTQPRNLADAIK